MTDRNEASAMNTIPRRTLKGNGSTVVLGLGLGSCVAFCEIEDMSI